MMTREDPLELQLQQLSDALAPEPTFVEAVMRRVADTSVAPFRPPVAQRLFHAILRPRRLAVAVCVLAIAAFWSIPFGSRTPGDQGGWWLGVSAANAQEVSLTLERQRVDGIVARSRTTFIMNDDSRNTSSTVSTYFFGRDRFRHDIYDDGKLREIQWYTPEGDDLVQTSYHVQDGSTSVDRHQKTEAASDPISHLVTIVGCIDRADHQFDPKEIDGHECVGFEISSDKIAPPSDTGTYRIWFDARTKLPVLVEFDRPTNIPNIQRMITSFDRFEWNPRLPAGTFAPHALRDPAGLPSTPSF